MPIPMFKMTRFYIKSLIPFCVIIPGLKDLADFLPASLATIVSYFSAEVTRGLWKPVFMNGTDWPSPAENLSNVEEQIKKILAATGVDVPSLAAGLVIVIAVKLLNENIKVEFDYAFLDHFQSKPKANNKTFTWIIFDCSSDELGASYYL